MCIAATPRTTSCGTCWMGTYIPLGVFYHCLYKTQEDIESIIFLEVKRGV